MFSRLLNQIMYKPDSYLDAEYIREKFSVGKIDIDIRIHRGDSNKVIILYPGADGSIDGYNDKYIKIANWMSASGVASVVRIDNLYCVDFLPYVEMMILKLSYVIDYIIDNAERLLGKKEIEIYIAGVSAGAGAVAAIFNDYPFIKKALLIAPYDSVGRENIERGLRGYEGELYLIAGLDDQIMTHEQAKQFYEISISNCKNLHLVPACDHQFKGKKNGLILSSAFMWAFSDSITKPNKNKGILLY